MKNRIVFTLAVLLAFSAYINQNPANAEGKEAGRHQIKQANHQNTRETRQTNKAMNHETRQENRANRQEFKKQMHQDLSSIKHDQSMTGQEKHAAISEKRAQYKNDAQSMHQENKANWQQTNEQRKANWQQTKEENKQNWQNFHDQKKTQQ